MLFECNAKFCSDILSFDSAISSIILWTNMLSVFRMAPPTRQTPGREDMPPPPPPSPSPPPPPPPAEAWQAMMAATNANTQMLLQLIQERANHQ